MKKVKQILALLAVIFGLNVTGIMAQNQICVDCNSSSTENGTPSNPYHTIQAAVDAAVNGDIIKVAKGTYSEAVQIEEKKIHLLGGFAGSGDFNSANPQTNVTVIAGTGSAPCVYVYINSDVEIPGSWLISGFTIRNGQRGIQLSGGWALNFNNITISNNIIENNGDRGMDGGGIAMEGHNVTIQNNIIRNNQAYEGAAIGTTDDVSNYLIADNRIENNTGYGYHGGGVFVNGSGTVTRNIFAGNVIGKDNDGGWGGAITIFSNPDDTAKVTLSHNIYYNNSTKIHGGAVFVDDGSEVRMEHELLYNNKSEKNGSAIHVDDASDHRPSVLYMDNCTVANNISTSNGAALYVEASITQIQNCIFWNNGNDFETVPDNGHNANLSVNYTLTQQGFTGTGNISSNPLFADAPNSDFHLQSTGGRFNPSTGQFVNDGADSPAIDAGNPSSDFSNEPAPNGGRVNLGCYGNTAEASKSANTGIKETRQNLWTVSPNPTSGQLRIENYDISMGKIGIYDIYGRKQKAESRKENVVDISHLQSGVYFLRIGNGTVKIVKQ
jgi:hypothetical protein